MIPSVSSLSERLAQAIDALDGSERTIVDASQFVLSTPPICKIAVANMLADALRQSLDGIGKANLTHVFYVINDVVQKDRGNAGGGLIKGALFKSLPPLLRRMMTSQDVKMPSRLRRVLDLWDERRVYSKVQMKQLKHAIGAKMDEERNEAPPTDKYVPSSGDWNDGDDGVERDDDSDSVNSYAHDESSSDADDDDDGGSGAGIEENPEIMLRATDFARVGKLASRCADDLSKLNSALELCKHSDIADVKRQTSSYAVELKLLSGLKKKAGVAEMCNMAYKSSILSLQEARNRVCSSLEALVQGEEERIGNVDAKMQVCADMRERLNALSKTHGSSVKVTRKVKRRVRKEKPKYAESGEIDEAAAAAERAAARKKKEQVPMVWDRVRKMYVPFERTDREDDWRD